MAAKDVDTQEVTAFLEKGCTENAYIGFPSNGKGSFSSTFAGAKYALHMQPQLVANKQTAVACFPLSGADYEVCMVRLHVWILRLFNFSVLVLLMHMLECSWYEIESRAH